MEYYQLPMHTKIFYAKQGVLLCKTYISIKQSAKVILGLIDLEQHTARDKQAVWILENLSAAHTFDYIVLRIKPDLTSYEDLAIWPCYRIEAIVLE